MSAVTKAPCANMLGQKMNNNRDRNPPHLPNSSLDQKKINAPKVAPNKEIIALAWKSITDGSFPKSKRIDSYCPRSQDCSRPPQSLEAPAGGRPKAARPPRPGRKSLLLIPDD
jgi:hypothetical protein